MGWPTVRELLQKVIEHKSPSMFAGACSGARGVSDGLSGKNAQFMNPKLFANLVVQADRVVSL